MNYHLRLHSRVLLWDAIRVTLKVRAKKIQGASHAPQIIQVSANGAWDAPYGLSMFPPTFNVARCIQ